MSRRSSIVQGTVQRSIPSEFGGFAAGATPMTAQQQQSPAPGTPYGSWMAGQPGTVALPRPVEDFLTGAFGPLNPLVPVGIDQPQDGDSRPLPRRWQYPVGWNMPIGQPGTEGLKLTSYANLRAYADLYSVIRAAIQLRKDEITGLDWDVIPTDVASKNMRDNPDVSSDFQDRRTEALRFFKRPDSNYHDFQTWLSALLEDIFVVDALSLYLHPTRVPGRGLFGSDLAALEVLDGTTIRPLVDIRGGVPRPPAVAYEQYLWGVPRSDYMDIILDSDIEWMDEPVSNFRGDQIIYAPYVRRSWTPYGFPPLERALVPVITGIKKQEFILDFFQEGSIPGMFVIPGPDVSTPQQIRQLQDTLNALAGDTAMKHRIIVLPPGSASEQMKKTELVDQFDENIMVQALMAYDVMPAELGILQRVTQSPSAGAGNQMAKAAQTIANRKSLKPLLMWLKRTVFDFVLQDLCGQVDMQWMWQGLNDGEELSVESDTLKTMITYGLKSIDEARSELGLNPWGLPLTSDPLFIGPNGPIPLGNIDPNREDAMLQLTPMASSADAAQGTPQQSPAVAPPPASSVPQAAPAVPAPPAPTTYPTVPLESHGTPLHPSYNSKAAADELRRMRRWLRKGHTIGQWDPIDLPVELYKYALVREEHENSDIAALSVAEIVKSMPIAAGLAVKAADTGRVLLLQRALSDGEGDDPAAGKWEFPGGHIEDDEDSLTAAKREWVEEVGRRLPDGQVDGTWLSDNGVYRGFVYVIQHESLIDLKSPRTVDNPDGDYFEACAWFDVDDLPNMPSLRIECKNTPWDVLTQAKLTKNFTVSSPLSSGFVPFDLQGASGKVSKQQVHYRPATTIQKCETCSMFIKGSGDGPATCSLVAGTIDPMWTCDQWEAGYGSKQNAVDARSREVYAAYRGMSQAYAAQLTVGAQLFDVEATAATKYRAQVADEPVVVKVLYKGLEERNGYVRFPAGAIYKVIAVSEREVVIEHQG